MKKLLREKSVVVMNNELFKSNELQKFAEAYILKNLMYTIK